ncbi:unnamed protein product [Anisakis simplex]|uniref:DUF4156 domain-containing protein n=1 Tax=Anisakis simplex TaxID=6269 RepID=A0A0M3K8G0_ANISI|nr:unnamed protein product [Anisakis simplex]
MRIVFVLLFTLNGFVLGKEWTASNMPDPRDKSGYMKCNMKSLSKVCDPDEVLSSTDRYRINHEVNQLAQRTTHSGGNFCQTKGIESILVAVQSVSNPKCINSVHVHK